MPKRPLDSSNQANEQDSNDNNYSASSHKKRNGRKKWKIVLMDVRRDTTILFDKTKHSERDKETIRRSELKKRECEKVVVLENTGIRFRAGHPFHDSEQAEEITKKEFDLRNEEITVRKWTPIIFNIAQHFGWNIEEIPQYELKMRSKYIHQMLWEENLDPTVARHVSIGLDLLKRPENEIHLDEQTLTNSKFRVIVETGILYNPADPLHRCKQTEVISRFEFVKRNHAVTILDKDIPLYQHRLLILEQIQGKTCWVLKGTGIMVDDKNPIHKAEEQERISRFELGNRNQEVIVIEGTAVVLDDKDPRLAGSIERIPNYEYQERLVKKPGLYKKMSKRFDRLRNPPGAVTLDNPILIDASINQSNSASSINNSAPIQIDTQTFQPAVQARKSRHSFWASMQMPINSPIVNSTTNKPLQDMQPVASPRDSLFWSQANDVQTYSMVQSTPEPRKDEDSGIPGTLELDNFLRQISNIWP